MTIQADLLVESCIILLVTIPAGEWAFLAIPLVANETKP